MRQQVAILAVGLPFASCGSSRSQSPTGGSGGGSVGTGASGGQAQCGDARAPTLSASAGARVYLSGHSVFGCSPAAPAASGSARAAWIAALSSAIAHRHMSDLHRLDRHGFALLDSGQGGSLTRLALSGSTLSWLHGGARRSTTLG